MENSHHALFDGDRNAAGLHLGARLGPLLLSLIQPGGLRDLEWLDPARPHPRSRHWPLASREDPTGLRLGTQPTRHLLPRAVGDDCAGQHRYPQGKQLHQLCAQWRLPDVPTGSRRAVTRILREDTRVECAADHHWSSSGRRKAVSPNNGVTVGHSDYLIWEGEQLPVHRFHQRCHPEPGKEHHQF